MDKIKEMSEGIVVTDAPTHRTTIDGVRGKRNATTGETPHSFNKADCIYFQCLCETCRI